MSDARETLDLSISEKDFQALVVETAQRLGWLVFHPFDMRRSRQGYPDLTLVHEGKGMIVFAEMKRESGTTSEHQKHWLHALHSVEGRINGEGYYNRMYVRVWRPSGWEDVVRVLEGGAR